MQEFEAGEIGAQALNCALVFVDHKVGLVDFHHMRRTGTRPESGEQLVRSVCAGLGQQRGEIHRQEIVVLADGERPAEARLKSNFVCSGWLQVEQHMGGSQRRVAAEPDLAEG